MIDYFALLHEPRRPWIDADVLKTRFLELSAEAHPDRVHGAAEAIKKEAQEQFLELNAAYNCLREPKSRVQHLLELELGAKPREVQEIDPNKMKLFVAAGQLCREVHQFLAQRTQVTSSLLKVEMFERAQEWTERLRDLQKDLSAGQEALLAELKQMNAHWAGAPAEGDPKRRAALPLAQLERIWRDLSYIARWIRQTEEQVAQLFF